VADIFVSYTSKDREWAFWIGHELKRLGHKPRIHDWDIAGGDDIMEWMELNIQGADRFLCVVSRAYLNADYSRRELRAAQWTAASDRPSFVLPVFVEDCSAPLWLANIKRCELFNLTEAKARVRLEAYFGGPSVTTAHFPGNSNSAEALPAQSKPTFFLGDDIPRPEGLAPAIAFITDLPSLQAWLVRQSSEASAAIAARAALRAMPLASQAAAGSNWAGLMSAIFRAGAVARAAGKYPARADYFRSAGYHAATAFDDQVNAPVAGFNRAGFAATAAWSAANGARAAAFGHEFALAAADAARNAADSVDAAARAAESDDADIIWEEARRDVAMVGSAGATVLADAPLWPRGVPDWARKAWAVLRAALPKDEDWDVWIEWYEERVRGGSRGETYELPFVSAPMDVWDQGPAAANAWIRGHLP
jgi:hypothetical protein